MSPETGWGVGYWTLMGLVAFCLMATLATKWLVDRRQTVPTFPVSPLAIISDLVWCLTILGGGIVAARYIERTQDRALGWLIFGCVALGLSLVRSLLLARTRQQTKPRSEMGARELLGSSLPTLNYLLLSAAPHMTSSLLRKTPADPILFVPAFIGALLPDLDSRDSVLGRLLPPVSRRIEDRLGHLQELHSLGACICVAMVSAPLVPFAGWYAWLMLPAGYLSHLALDMLHPEGIMLFWPLSRARYSALGNVRWPGSRDLALSAVLTLITVVLFVFAGVGKPAPPRLPAPSFENAFDRYRSLRGRNLVFADVDGNWQASGRRLSARFEILDAVERSFILVDRYSGRIFSAGRSSSDNLYVNAINVVAGSPAQVKPVEIELHDQSLAEALPVVYQMQREPGLQHILVSGELITPLGQGLHTSVASLQAQRSQTQVPRIQSIGDRRFRFQYLGAVELIELANVQVEMANLVITATYTNPPSGPTATPLPSPPPAPGQVP